MPISSPTEDYSVPSIIPRASLEQMIIQRSIADAQFRQDLIADPVSTLGTFFGSPLPTGLDVRVYVENANTFYYVTPNTNPDLGNYNTETGVAPPLMSARESFVGRVNYLLSETDADPDDLDRLTQAMQAADSAADQASIAARNAEMEAVQAASTAQNAVIAYGEVVAAALLVPDDPGLTQAVAAAQSTMQTKQHEAATAATNASNLRDTASQLSAQATDADEAYEAALRAAFQQAFAVNPVNALNSFLNLNTPFTSFATIYDTDLPGSNTPPSAGMCFTHLVETTGSLIFIVLPYTTNRSLLMGPYSISFDGASSYIQVPHSVSMDVRQVIAVEAWVWVDSFREGYTDVVLSTLNGSGGWQLEVGGGIPKFTLTLGGAAQSVIPDDDGLILKPAKWHYLVGAFAGDTLFLYVNGFKWGESTVEAAEITPGGDLLMGRSAVMQADQSFLLGMIHEVRLWGDAITLDFIIDSLPSHQDTSTLPTPVQEALIAHYLFDEGANFTAIDDSANHNNGQMVNAVWKITGHDSPA